MAWFTKALQSIRDLTLIVLTVVGVIAVVRWMTKGKWPNISQAGDVVAPPANANDLPSEKDLDKYLEKKSLSIFKSLSLVVVMCSLLSSSTLTSAATTAGAEFTNACVLGMYEYRQLLDGKSVDKLTNVLHIEDGLYKMYFDMSVRVYDTGRERHILRIIPVKLDSKPSPSTSWVWVAIASVAGFALGSAVAK